MMSLFSGKVLFQFLKNNIIWKTTKRSSALFVNGAKATDKFTYVTPHIDWPERVADEERLCRDLQRRRSNINLDELKSLWQLYTELVDNKNKLEEKKGDISKKISELLISNNDLEAVEKYKIHANMIRDSIKNLKISLWSIEENVITRILKVPNSLHEFTPDEPTVLSSCLSRPTSGANHLDANKLIRFDDNKNYYLCDDAAVFELGAKFYFSNLLREQGFVQFSNPDFAKSVVLEGCGTDHTDSNYSFILHHAEDTKVNEDSRLHLVGGASLPSFFAYYTKNSLNPASLPLKYFTMGRKYVPAEDGKRGLFNVNQSSAVEIFSISKTYNEMNQTLMEMIHVCKNIYTSLGVHYRLSYASPQELLQWESLRVKIEMYSFSLSRYVEIGNISASGDYITKRLMLTFSEKKELKFPFIVSGTMLNVPRLLACYLEQGPQFRLPDPFKVENWLNYSN